MNKEQQRIKIAEAYGWKPDDDGAGLNTWEASWVGLSLYGLRPNRRSDGTVDSYTVDCLVPDYLNDLNAMHKAESILTDGQWFTYCGYLALLTNGRGEGATAAQRAEAFLRTLDLWKP